MRTGSTHLSMVLDTTCSSSTRTSLQGEEEGREWRKGGREEEREGGEGGKVGKEGERGGRRGRMEGRERGRGGREQ